MANKIIVYTKHNCPNCMHVKFGLEAAGVEFETKNIEEKVEYKTEFDKYGYSAAPVTVFPSGKVLVGFEFGEFATELGL
ncbi:glutaredoxin family protein [Bacillus sp. TL12]|uniref:glutaredoxin family protein n=1 Tax=Bacillus sp. TL12 TaxID=2894756 RepID=UPI001F51FC57|nr:glutaredoxin family protein [Bacillus sp. TL12]MCI0767374.1 glutaredoxin family protein [Bacillus sp. TL12]